MKYPAILFNFTLNILLTIMLTACCNKDSIPKAERLLYSNLARERNDAALELARCGSAADKAVPRLSQLLYDENVGVQSASAYALRKIDTQSARDALKRAEDARKR